MNKAFQTVQLGDSHFQFLTSKTGWTKAQFRDMDTGSSSDIPLYTATQEPVAFIGATTAKPIPASEESPVISFGANGDGSAGTNFVYHTQPFFVSNDRTCLRITNSLLLPKFIYFKLHGIKKLYGFDFNYKATPQNASQISIDVPVFPNGKFDVSSQQRLIESSHRYQIIKKRVDDEKDRIASALVTLEIPEPFKEVSLGDRDLFNLFIGKRILKREIGPHAIPVFSANIRSPFGFVKSSIVKDFSQPSLIWGIDGIFDWNLIPAKKPFMPTDHCGVIRILDADIDPNYVFYTLRSTKERYGFDRTFRASLTNIRDVTVKLPYKNGRFNLKEQISLAARYERIYRIKKEVVEVMANIVETPVMV